MRLTKVKVYETNLIEAKDLFIQVKKAQGLRPSSMKDYNVELSKFCAVSSFETLENDVLTYFSLIPDTSPAVFNRPYGCLNAFFNWCCKQNYIERNPFASLGLHKRKDEGNIKPATIKDIKKLLANFDTSTFTGLRNYCITLLILDTGIRTSELVRLKDSDLDCSTKSIIVSKNNSKTKSKRNLFLSPKTFSMIQKLISLKPPSFSDYIFPSREGNQLITNELSREFRKCCKKSGINITPYQLRHSYATYCCQSGMNLFVLQKVMGHSDLRTTKRYTELDDKAIVEEQNKFSPLNLVLSKRI